MRQVRVACDGHQMRPHLLWARAAYRPRVYRDLGVTPAEGPLRLEGESGRLRSSCKHRCDSDIVRIRMGLCFIAQVTACRQRRKDAADEAAYVINATARRAGRCMCLVTAVQS